MAEKGYLVQKEVFVARIKSMLLKEEPLHRLMLTEKLAVVQKLPLPKPIVKVNRDMYGLLGCNLGVWKDDLLAVNGFDEDYEGWGREDSDLEPDCTITVCGEDGLRQGLFTTSIIRRTKDNRAKTTGGSRKRFLAVK